MSVKLFFLSLFAHPIQLMHDIMVKPLPAGCRLTSIFDVRFPHILSQGGRLNCCCLVVPFRLGAWLVVRLPTPTHSNPDNVITDLPYMVSLISIN